jgi:hypothetical protein
MVMNKFILLLIIILSNLIPISFAQTASKDFANELGELKNEVDRIQNNQLNYKIEKDLLKETYSTQFQTINAIILNLSLVGTHDSICNYLYRR